MFVIVYACVRNHTGKSGCYVLRGGGGKTVNKNVLHDTIEDGRQRRAFPIRTYKSVDLSIYQYSILNVMAINVKDCDCC